MNTEGVICIAISILDIIQILRSCD